MEERTLGIIIFDEINETEKRIEAGLIKLNAGLEWFVRVGYKFELVKGKIRDSFTVTVVPYLDDEKQGEYKFSFTSVEVIFLNELCDVMHKITKNPCNADAILRDAKVTIKYVKEDAETEVTDTVQVN